MKGPSQNTPEVTAPFLTRLAEPRPDPGGGAAAAYACVVALSATLKVARLEARRTQGEHTEEARRFAASAEGLLADFNRLIEEDSQAYEVLLRAKRNKAQGEELRKAVERAGAPPVQIMKTAAAACALIWQLGRICRRELTADLLVAIEILGGAITAVYWIAASNLSMLEKREREKRSVEILTLLDDYLTRFRKVRKSLSDRNVRD